MPVLCEQITHKEMAMMKEEKRMYCSVGGDHVRNGRLALGDRLKQSFWLSKCTVALTGQMHCNLHCENAAKVLRMELLSVTSETVLSHCVPQVTSTVCFFGVFLVFLVFFLKKKLLFFISRFQCV